MLPRARWHRNWHCEAESCATKFTFGGRHHCRVCGCSVCDEHFLRPSCVMCMTPHSSSQSCSGNTLSSLASTPTTLLSELIFEAFRIICSRHSTVKMELDRAVVGIKVGRQDWCIVTMAHNTAESCIRAKTEPHTCTATLVFSDENTFSQLIDGHLSGSAAVASRRLQVSGPMAIVTATQALFEQAETMIRECITQSREPLNCETTARKSVEEEQANGKCSATALCLSFAKSSRCLFPFSQ